MKLCGERKSRDFLFESIWKILGACPRSRSGNVLLRREQYRRADDVQFATEVARGLVLAKVANSRKVLMRAIRDHPETSNRSQLDDAVTELARIAESLGRAGSLEAMRGHEGEAAQTYFGAFDHLIVAQKEDFFFKERSRRPPLDNMNALLSFCYALLTNDVVSALETVGLDPAVGYFHTDRPGRPSLALDLMEEFRPFLADRLALALVNRQQVSGPGFKTTESGAVAMDDETRKTLLVAYQKRKQEEIQHPFINEKIAVGLLPLVQAMLFARFLRGDIDGYPPFFWK